MGGGGWVDQLGLKLTQSPTGVGVGVGTELGNRVLGKFSKFYNV